MFTALIRLITVAAIITFASPVFAETFQLSVTIPPHAMPVQASMTGQEPILSTIPQITEQQVTQVQQITRNNQTVTVQSVVVL